MSRLERQRDRDARDQILRDRMPRVLAASRRLQSALELFDEDPWPTPIVPVQAPKDVAESNTSHLRDSLRICELFAVDMARKTESMDFLDHRVLEFYEKELETVVAKQEPFVAEPGVVDVTKKYFKGKRYTGVDLDTLDTVMANVEYETAPKVGGPTQEAVSGEAIMAIGAFEASNEELASQKDDQHNIAISEVPRDNTGSKGRSNVTFARQTKVSLQSAIPNPLSMPGTFTNAICHQKEFFPAPILALTMMDITPAMLAPTTPRCVLLSHLEVGLDSIEALCQGSVTIDESTYWRENVREQRIGRLGLVKAGRGGYSEALKQEQLKKGMGRGEWLWFGIKFQQSGKEKKKKKGGKWACFGVPMEALKLGVTEEGKAMCGGGVDGDGNEVPKHEVKVNRMTYRLSIGGIACMDLYEGEDQWQKGAWAEIKKAMAHNGLLIRVVVPSEEMMELVQLRAAKEMDVDVDVDVDVEGKGKGKA